MAILPENWRPIPGYEGLYEMSDLRRIKSLKRFHRGKDIIMKKQRHSKHHKSNKLIVSLSAGKRNTKTSFTIEKLFKLTWPEL